MESSRGGSIRIQHLTASTGSPSEGRSRFPKLDECAHFHYEQVELGPFQVGLYDEELKPLACEDSENKWWHVSVTSQGKTWVLRRSYDNFRMLDQQLHRCIYDRKFSGLAELPLEDNVPGTNQEENIRRLLTDYLARFSQIAGNLINCGPVLNWLELDNRGRRLLVPDGDNCPINTPAVAAAYSVKRYTAQAGDEISFEVGDMISVIDMPPPEESVWWRGKRGFQVGFFPCECVAVIGDKVPRNLQLPSVPEDQPSKPVLRKHGKLIAFFRSFILSRPSRRRLKQSGILKERVFGCDLGEHLLNSGHEIPMVLKCCAEFIESHGIVDGIYRLSGVTSNIQKLRNAFDEDRVPALYEDEAILQDIHSVASLLKMYFRELPNPLCTYQLYHTFVSAVQSSQEEGFRLLRMRDAVQKLPPPHYRTLEYLMRHLARVAERGHMTGMTPRNVAIVWAPNLLRCKELEVGGVAALQGVGVQAVVTEFLVCYTDLIFCDGLPPINLPQQEVTPKRSRPKSLAISTPTKLLSLEEARSRALLSAGKADQEYIEVGGGPSNLPAKYHTVIELPGSARKRAGSKRSPLGWKSFFSKSGRKSSAPQRKASTPSDLGLHQEKAVTEADLAQGRRRLRPVKSAESLASGATSSRNSAALEPVELCTPEDATSPSHAGSKASGHNRSVSHDSYFDHLAETPVHSRPTIRPSRLQEEDNEDNFSSSLDLSEIQLNFDLEESEMRIFSEDETLVSTSVGSGSLMSQGSPRVGMFRARQHGLNLKINLSSLPSFDSLQDINIDIQYPTTPSGLPDIGAVNLFFTPSNEEVGSKRVPMRELPPPRARPEDPLSGCPSTDPSPKKQKTCGSTSPGSSRSKRSRLEEQLACSSAELRYIDSQSPENQVLVHAEIHANHQHHQYSNLPDINVSPNNHTNNTSPSLADATVSDNESFTLHSSGLTTPDTPLLLYAPLMDDSNDSSNTTPDYENLTKLTPSPGNKYERLGAQSLTPSPTNVLGPRMDSDAKFDRFLGQTLMSASSGQDGGDTFCRIRYENVPVTSQSGTKIHSDVTHQCEVNQISSDDSKLNQQVTSYVNVPPDSPVNTAQPVRSPVKKESQIVIKYENVLTESPTKKSPMKKQPDHDAYEVIWSETPRGEVSVNSGAYEVMPDVHTDLGSHSAESKNIVYQNISSILELGQEEDHLYEDVQVAPTASLDMEQGHSSPSKRSSQTSEQPDPNVEVYQQVKYLRRSIHEVNQLLDDGAETQGSVSLEGSEVKSIIGHVANELEGGASMASDAVVINHEDAQIPVDENHLNDENVGSVDAEKIQNNLNDDGLIEGETCDEVEQAEVPKEVSLHLDTVKVLCSEDLGSNKDSGSFKCVAAVGVQSMETEDTSLRTHLCTEIGEQLVDHREQEVQKHSSEIETDCNHELKMESYDKGNSLQEMSLPATLADFESDRDESYVRVCIPTNIECSGSHLRSETSAASRLLAKERHGSTGSGSEGRDASMESPMSSPERRSLSSALGSPLDSSRRKFESEIGRDIVRERKMRQELEEVRTASQGSGTTSPQQQLKASTKQSVKCNIRELLSKFETSPTQPEAEILSNDTMFTCTQETDPTCDENSSRDSILLPITSVLATRAEPNPITSSVSSVISTSAKIGDSPFCSLTPKPVRRSDLTPKSNTGSLPPCMRARAAKAARSKLANSTSLSVSLDGDQFLVSSSNPQSLLRVQTSPDINMSEHRVSSASEIKERIGEETSHAEITAHINTRIVIDMDDPQRRERIERYKEERRMFLREKYRSESFRGERDEILQRLKQKAGKSLSSPTDEAMDMTRSLSSGERVRTSSFRSTGDKSDASDADQTEQGNSLNERLVDINTDRVREKRYGRHISPKKYENDSVSGDESSRRTRILSSGEDSFLKPNRKSKLDDESYCRQRSSVSEKDSVSSSSPEKSPITCVTVRQRLSSDRMTVNTGLSSGPKSPREGWAPVNDKQVAVDESRSAKHMLPSPSLERRVPSHNLIDSTVDKLQYSSENVSKKQGGSVMDKPSDRRTNSGVKSPSRMRQSSTADTFTERRLTSKVGSVEKRPSSTDYSAEIRLTSKGYSFEKRQGGTENRSVELRLSPKGASSTCNDMEVRQTSKRSSYDSPGVEIRSKGSSADIQRRPVSSPEKRAGDSPRRRASTECAPRLQQQTSPSYCIRDMAALFENREAASAPPSRPGSGKQYLSSV